MKILLVGNYIQDGQTSMQLFAKMLYNLLSQSGHEVKLIRPKKCFCFSQRPCAGISKWLGYIDKLLLFPDELKKNIGWADIIHICDHSNAVYVRHVKNKPHLVTCHDMLAIRSALGEFKQNKISWSGRSLQGMILRGLKDAKTVICVSEATRKDFLRITWHSAEDVFVVYSCLNYDYKRMSDEDKKKVISSIGLSDKDHFLLNVGNNSWYKNRPGVVSIFCRILKSGIFDRLRIVFVGGRPDHNLAKAAKMRGLKEKVSFLSDLSHEKLCALYSSAEALLQPSFAEGFGWPIIEAQACGCPVFTSNRPPMTETGGDGAAYIDPDNHEQAAALIVDTLKNPGKLNFMRESGLKNIERFSANRMISEYCEIYRKVIGQNK